MDWTSSVIADARPLGVVSFERVAILGSRMVAVGGRRDLTTPLFAAEQGDRWTLDASLPDDRLVETLYVDAGRFWVIAHRGDGARLGRELWSSRDGLSWTQRRGLVGLDFGSGRIDEVAIGDERRLALALHDLDTEPVGSIPLLYESGDRRSWSQVEPPLVNGVTQGIRDLVAGDGNFVLLQVVDVADQVQPIAQVTVDGLNWVPIRISATALNNLHDVAYGPGGFVAAGSARFVDSDAPFAAHSPDGLAWTDGSFAETPGPGAASMDLVLPLGAGFIGVGYVQDETLAAWRSADGVTWLRDESFSPEFGWVTAGAASADRIVLVGQSEGGDVVPQVWVANVR